MKVIYKSVSALAIAMAIWNSAVADPLRIESPQTQATLVELYTSEGCSSCPPADRWLNGLKSDPRLWREVVPVAFHVDYWNYLGWRDRFSAPEYSQRQRDYARHGLLRTVYTPGFVVNGKEWRGWFRRPQLTPDPAKVAGRLSAELDGERLAVRYQPATAPSGALTLHVARLGFDLATRVQEGENSGRLLRHDFVVLGHAEQVLDRVAESLQASVELPRASVHADRQAVALWVTRRGDPRPLQAAGGWID
ncbi:MAG: hypothetical protein Kow006_05860 [Gammaproteobacteria bacterium]